MFKKIGKELCTIIQRLLAGRNPCNTIYKADKYNNMTIGNKIKQQILIRT